MPELSEKKQEQKNEQAKIGGRAEARSAQGGENKKPAGEAKLPTADRESLRQGLKPAESDTKFARESAKVNAGEARNSPREGLAKPKEAAQGSDNAKAAEQAKAAREADQRKTRPKE